MKTKIETDKIETKNKIKNIYISYTETYSLLSKYMKKKIFSNISNNLFNEKAGEIFIIVLLFVILSYKDNVFSFSQTSIGKSFILFIILYYYLLNPKIGLIMSILFIMYYYSDLILSYYQYEGFKEKESKIPNSISSNPMKKSIDHPFMIGKFTGNITVNNVDLPVKLDISGKLYEFHTKIKGTLKNRPIENGNLISFNSIMDSPFNGTIHGEIFGRYYIDKNDKDDKQVNTKNYFKNTYKYDKKNPDGYIKAVLRSDITGFKTREKIFMNMKYGNVLIIKDKKEKIPEEEENMEDREKEEENMEDQDKEEENKEDKEENMEDKEEENMEVQEKEEENKEEKDKEEEKDQEGFKDIETSMINDAYPFTTNQQTIPSKFYTNYKYKLPKKIIEEKSKGFSEFFKSLLSKTDNNKSNNKNTKEGFSENISIPYQKAYDNNQYISPQTHYDVDNNRSVAQKAMDEVTELQARLFREKNCNSNQQLLFKNSIVRPDMAEHIFPNLQINDLAGANGMKCNPCDPHCHISLSLLDQRLENENIIQKRNRNEYNETNQDWVPKFFDVFVPNPMYPVLGNNHNNMNGNISNNMNSSYLIPANARIMPIQSITE